MHLLEDLDLDQIPSAALLVRVDGSIVRANRRSELLFGYGPGELAGLEIEQLIRTHHRQECPHLLEAAFTDLPAHSPVKFQEFEGVTKDGRDLPVEIGIGPPVGGTYALAEIRDLTAATHTLARLHDSESRLKIGLLHTRGLVQVIDIDKDHLSWYGDLDGLLGYKFGEFPRTLSGWFELIHPDDVERIQADVERVIENDEGGWQFRYRLLAKDGSYRHILDRGSTTGYLDGRPNEGIGGIVDETEHFVAQQALRSALTETADQKDRLFAETWYLRRELASSHGFDEILGKSEALRATLEQVESVALTDATVLLLGETGTGKELVARAIHGRSRRNEQPLIKVDCGTLPAGLIESELFGHEKGSFTGAHQQKIGRFELAHEGTIFLDEIGELPMDLQAKLLRVIEVGEFQKVGGTSEQSVDVRVIAATNRDLRLEVREGRFRSDLYFRLSVFPIEVPPLRERREDIPLLTSFFVSKYAAALGKSVPEVAPSSLDALMAYDWPGNVRELRNVIERSVILSNGGPLAVDPAILGKAEPGPAEAGPLKLDLQAVERARIIRTLDETSWTVKGEGNAASRLGVTPSGLRSRMKKLGIKRPG